MKQNSFFVKQNRSVKVLLLLMAVWMIWFIGSAIAGQVRDAFVQSEEVRYVTMEHVETGYGVCIAVEHVMHAELDGNAEPIVAEGERVRKYNAVFRINDQEHHTNYAGRVSYVIDGLENVADIGVISELDLKDSYNKQQRKNKNSDIVTAGDSYAKVQDTMGGLSLYVSVPVTAQTTELGIGQSTKVRLLDIDDVVKGEIVEVLHSEDNRRIMKVELGLTNENVFQQRIYQIELPYNSERVITIPKQALAKKRGVDGVYYLHKGFVFWKEVTVSDRWIDQGVLVVESGLEEGDVVVTTPKLVREGENIKF